MTNILPNPAMNEELERDIDLEEVQRFFHENSARLFDSENCFYNITADKLPLYHAFFKSTEAEVFLCDEQLVSSAIAFIENDLNLTVASKVSFMHRNTLVYRLDKIEKITGLNLRKFKDSVIVYNMLVFYRLMKK